MTDTNINNTQIDHSTTHSSIKLYQVPSIRACHPYSKSRLSCKRGVSCGRCSKTNRNSQDRNNMDIPALLSDSHNLSSPLSYSVVSNSSNYPKSSLSIIDKTNVPYTNSHLTYNRENFSRLSLPSIESLKPVGMRYTRSDTYTYLKNEEDYNTAYFQTRRKLSSIGSGAPLGISTLSILYMIPPKPVCDYLVGYFFDFKIDDSCVIHRQTFITQYNTFWEVYGFQGQATDCNTIWLALLLSIIATVLVSIPRESVDFSVELSEYLGKVQDINNLHDSWFNMVRKILESYSKEGQELDCTTKLQVFCSLLVYLSITKRFDVIDDFVLKEAIKTSYRMGLDTTTSSDFVDSSLRTVEIHRRIWWNLCNHDTERALKLLRKPIILSSLSEVPFPGNYEDDDLQISAETTTPPPTIRPKNIKTDVSFIILRSKMYKILNGIFHIQVTEKPIEIFKKINVIDQQLSILNKYKPQFLKVEGISKNQTDRLTAFQANMFHLDICMHRFKLYANYIPLNLRSSIPLTICQMSLDLCFKKFNYLNLLYELERDPLFIRYIGKILQGVELLLVAVLSGFFQINEIHQDIKLVLLLLKLIEHSNIMLIPSQSLLHSINLLTQLQVRSLELKDLESLLCPSLLTKKSSLEALVFFENYDLDFKPHKDQIRENLISLKEIFCVVKDSVIFQKWRYESCLRIKELNLNVDQLSLISKHCGGYLSFLGNELDES